MLWINGPAGFGKTILCARLVQHLMDKAEDPVAYFFFSADSVSRDDTSIALRTWIWQIMSQNDGAFDIVRRKQEFELSERATRTALLTLLQDVLQLIPGFTLVVDGLDECTIRSQMTDFLHDVQRAMNGTSTRLLIVSRDIAEIRCALNGFSEIKITGEIVKEDINCYAKTVIDQKLSNKSEEIKKDISCRMADRCEGQFLWLKIQSGSLKRSFNHKQLQNSIKDAPVGLDHLYERDWAEIQKTNKRDAARAVALLRWTAFSIRPLTVFELTEAVLLKEDAHEFPIDELPDDIDQDYLNDEILGLCGSLLEIRNPSVEGPLGSRTVQLAHFSVKQYLLLNLPSLAPGYNLMGSRDIAAENLRLAKLCLQYISYPRTWQSCEGENNTHNARLRDYAAGSWHLHGRLSASDAEPYDKPLLDLTTAFFNAKHPCWSVWREWVDVNVGGYSEEDLASESMPPGPLFYAAQLNLRETLDLFIRTCPSIVNARSSNGRNALCTAAGHGHKFVVSALIDAGADVNNPGRNNIPPLSYASEDGHFEVAKLLLQHGARVNETDTKYGWSPLLDAAVAGHVDVVKLLMEHGADSSIANIDGWTPINGAARLGHANVVKLLLDYDSNTTTTQKSGMKPLYSAVVGGSLAAVQLLLDAGADVHATNGDGTTPVSKAAAKGQVDIVKLLLDKGAKPVNVEKDGETPLSKAAVNGNLEVVKLLTEKGLDMEPTTVSKAGIMPVYNASGLGHTEVVDFLTKKGFDFKTPSDNGWAPLHIAAAENHVQVMRLLVENGAEITAPTKDGWTALAAAACNGHINVIRMLFEYEATSSIINKGNDDGWTPLSLATNCKCVEAMELLLGKGADVTVANNEGKTPLHFAVEKGCLDAVRLLLDSGADATAVMKDGGTPLDVASQKGHTEILKLLEERVSERQEGK